MDNQLTTQRCNIIKVKEILGRNPSVVCFLKLLRQSQNSQTQMLKIVSHQKIWRFYTGFRPILNRRLWNSITWLSYERWQTCLYFGSASDWFCKTWKYCNRNISCSINNNFVVKGNMSIKYVKLFESRFNSTIFNFLEQYKHTFIFNKIAPTKKTKSCRIHGTKSK